MASEPTTTKEILDSIIAEASAFSEHDVQTQDAFQLIVELAHDLERQLAEERVGVDALREQAIYGFTGETLQNLRDGMSAKEMNGWWKKRILDLLENK